MSNPDPVWKRNVGGICGIGILVGALMILKSGGASICGAAGAGLVFLMLLALFVAHRSHRTEWMPFFWTRTPLLPVDVEKRLVTLFPNSPEQEEVRVSIEGVMSMSLSARSATHATLGVAPVQLARSILVLSAGDVSIVRKALASNFWGDPRDMVSEAEKKQGWPGDYCSRPFNEP